MFENASVLRAALEAQQPVAFFINGYGDSYINLPAIRALSRIFSGKLSLVCRKGADLFCFDNLEVKKRIEINVWRNESGREFDVSSLVAEIGTCDLFLSLVPWHSFSMTELLNALEPKCSIGFYNNYMFCLERDFDKHSADLAFDTVLALQSDYRLEDFAAPVIYPEPDRQRVRQLLDMLDTGTKTLTVHADTLQEKMWDGERWASVLREFLENHQEFIVFVVGAVDQKLDTGRYSDRIIPCYGLPLSSSCCLVAESDFFLGVDSCMLHVADFARVPGVGLFGPTDAKEFGFRLGPHIMIQASGSMNSIRIEQVVSALDQLVLMPFQCNLWQAEGA